MEAGFSGCITKTSPPLLPQYEFPYLKKIKSYPVQQGTENLTEF